uniref:Uncharacterized protein n=1 Tax=Catharus ustulatus TaxID=91951 RepID=A0A8C3V0X9_CATUS
VEGGGRGLVEEQGHGARLVGLGHQHGVAAQHHGLVLHLVPVHPGEHLGVPAVGGAVGDAVQQVRVARPAGPLLAGRHADAMRPPVNGPRRGTAPLRGTNGPSGELPPPVYSPSGDLPAPVNERPLRCTDGPRR